MSTIKKQRAGTLIAVFALATLLLAQFAEAGVSTETGDVFGQGMDGPIVSPGGATLQRSDKGLSVKLTMPTPESGTYMYPPGNAFQPEGAIPGHPEAYSLWAFVFNYPDLCSEPCDSNDLGATPAQGGAFKAGGHIVGGGTLNLSGRVSKNSSPFVGSMLLEPQTAEVHLAVAPHGALQPRVLPDQIKKPIGSPGVWWLALFQ
jgi:hypothetical protein